MNQFFYETRAHEKVKDLLKEGQVSQAVRRSGAQKGSLSRDVLKLLLGFVSIISRIAVNQDRRNKNEFDRTPQENTLRPRKQTHYGTADR